MWCNVWNCICYSDAVHKYCSPTNTKLNKIQSLSEMGLLNIFPISHTQTVHFLPLNFVVSEILHCPQPTISRKTHKYSQGNFKTVNFLFLPLISVVGLTTPPASLSSSSSYSSSSSCFLSFFSPPHAWKFGDHSGCCPPLIRSVTINFANFDIRGIFHYEFVPTGQSTKFTIWKYWKGCVKKLDRNDPNFLPPTHGSFITKMHLLTRHCLWGSF